MECFVAFRLLAITLLDRNQTVTRQGVVPVPVAGTHAFKGRSHIG